MSRGRRGHGGAAQQIDDGQLAAAQREAERELLASVFHPRADAYWPIIESLRVEDFSDPDCATLRRVLDTIEHAPGGIGSISVIRSASGGALSFEWLSKLHEIGCSNSLEAERCRDAILRTRTTRALGRAVQSADPISEARRVLDLAEQRRAECAPREWIGLMSGGALFGLEFPPREALLGRWLFPGDRMLLHGPRGSGKSHLAMSIALAIAAGSEGPGLLGWAAPQALPVLYLDFELGARRLQRILHSSVFATYPPTPTGMLSICASCSRVADASGLQRLTELIEHVGARVVVVDSQTFAFAVESENDAAMWSPYADWINGLSAREITYIGLGHDGHALGRARGTSAREDSLDLVLGLERKGSNGGGIDISLSWSKTRGLAPGDVERLHVRLGSEHGPEDSSPAWWWEVDEDEARERRDSLNARSEAIRSLSAQGLQQIEIAARLGLSRRAVQRALQRGAGGET